MATITPFVKRMRTQGGTIFTFSSALEDIGLNINERNNVVKMSHYALLNLPSVDVPDNLQQNRFNVLAIPGAYESFLNSGSIKDSRVIIAESFQNYALNLETNLLAEDTYNPALTTTISERVFWKWLKETGAIRWSPEDTSSGRYWKEEIDTDTSVGYNSIVKCIGQISAGSVRTDTFGTYNETYVLVPTSFGQTPVYFKQVEDDNYYHGLSITGGLTNILGRETYFKPHPDALDIKAYYDLADSSIAVNSYAMNYDNSTGSWTAGWWWTFEGLPITEDRNYFIDSSTYISTGIYNIDLQYDTIGIEFKRSKVDCLSIEYDLNKLRTIFNDSTLTFDSLATDSAYVEDNEFDFNSILIYYSVYNKSLDIILATNLLGILFLDPPSGNTAAYPLSEITLPSITKLQSSSSGFGTSYSFRLNVKSDYMLDDTAATIVDETTGADADFVLTNFSEVFDNLGKTLAILNKHTGTINYITEQYLDITANQTNIINNITDLQYQVINNVINRDTSLNLDDIWTELNNLDASLNLYLLKTGDTMTGALTFASQGFTLDNVNIASIDTSTEGLSLLNTALATSATIKTYVDEKIVSGVGAYNGLSKIDACIGLGGMIRKHTVIDLSINGLEISADNKSKKLLIDSNVATGITLAAKNSVSPGGTTIDIENSQFYINFTAPSGISSAKQQLTMNVNGVTLDTSGGLIFSDNGSGTKNLISYGSNYGASMTDARILPDIGWVKYYFDNSIGSYVTYTHLNASINNIDTSLNGIWTNFGNVDTSLLNLGIKDANQDTSINNLITYVDGSFATNASVNLAIDIIEASLGTYAWNGLTKTDSSIGLGGPLHTDIAINVDDYFYKIQGIGNSDLFSINDQVFPSSHQISLQIGGGGFQSTEGVVLIYSAYGDDFLMQNGTIFTSANGAGIEYAVNYSGTYTDRSLVDKAYVINTIDACISTENFATNTSVNLALGAYATNASIGNQFYDITSGLLYIYDSNREKYLSSNRNTLNCGCLNLDSNTDTYMLVGSGVQSSSTGFKMFRNGTITAFSIDNDVSVTAGEGRTLQIRINDSSSYCVSLLIPNESKGAYLTNGNLDFSTGDILQAVLLANDIDTLNNAITLIEVAGRI